MIAITEVESEKLEFLDVSYCRILTDEGLKAFEGKVFPLTHLSFTGCTGITGKGLMYPIQAGKDTLTIFEGALMDQEEMKFPDFGKALGVCFNLQSIDLGGSSHIGDDVINFIFSGDKEEDGIKTKPGLQYLHTMKINFLTKISD